jgi:hypothetical protein
MKAEQEAIDIFQKTKAKNQSESYSVGEGRADGSIPLLVNEKDVGLNIGDAYVDRFANLFVGGDFKSQKADFNLCRAILAGSAAKGGSSFLLESAEISRALTVSVASEENEKQADKANSDSNPEGIEIDSDGTICIDGCRTSKKAGELLIDAYLDSIKKNTLSPTRITLTASRSFCLAAFKSPKPTPSTTAGIPIGGTFKPKSRFAVDFSENR